MNGTSALSGIGAAPSAETMQNKMPYIQVGIFILCWAVLIAVRTAGMKKALGELNTMLWVVRLCCCMIICGGIYYVSAIHGGGKLDDANSGKKLPKGNSTYAWGVVAVPIACLLCTSIWAWTAGDSAHYADMLEYQTFAMKQAEKEID
jgi:hypothetical protein